MNLATANVITADATVTDVTVEQDHGASQYGEESIFGVYDVGTRARVLLSRPRQQAGLLLAMAAIIINTSSLLALSRVKNRITCHFRLIISLSLSDILIALSAVLMTFNQIFNPTLYPGMGTYNDRVTSRCLYVVIKALNTIGLNVTLLNLAAMSADHYLAISQPLHYNKLLTARRCRGVIVVIWIVATCCGFSDFVSVLPNRHLLALGFNTCEAALATVYTEEFTSLALTGLVLVVMVVVYLKICTVIHRYRPPRKYSNRSAIKRNVRSLMTTALILGCFCLCWLPYCAYQVAMLIISQHSSKDTLEAWITSGRLQQLIEADRYLYNLILLNCVCDPVIYTIRTFDVRLGYRRICGGCCCSAHGRHDTYYQTSARVVARRTFTRAPPAPSHPTTGALNAAVNHAIKNASRDVGFSKRRWMIR